MAKRARKPVRKLTKLQRREKYTQQARDRRQKTSHKKYNQHTICFNCRRKGHAVADCPNAASGTDGTKGGNICYKCGSDEHSLKLCPKLTPGEKKMSKEPRGMDYHQMVLPFATCFVCKETGHLSSQCKQNENGVYVKGGCCKGCGSKTHLSFNCPELKKKKASEEDNDDEQSAGDVEEFLEEDVSNKEKLKQDEDKPKQVKKKKVVNF
jgi:hypothetical protein